MKPARRGARVGVRLTLGPSSDRRDQSLQTPGWSDLEMLAELLTLDADQGAVARRLVNQFNEKRQAHHSALGRARHMREGRTAELERIKREVIQSARDRKKRNAALSKSSIAERCFNEFRSDQVRTVEQVRHWLKGVDL